MSHFFEVYVFTASTEDYAEAIVGHLNAKKKTIQGILSRNHCLETHQGLRIKDLRIVKNRPLSDIVIVDNLVHSFGLQLDNGIPILDFTDNKNDRELLGL
jgi:CTD small phosphatase-like protein 2